MSLSSAQASISSAIAMLQESGEPVIFSYSTGGSYNEDTGETTASIPATQSAYGYPLEYANSEIDGVRIMRGDVNLLCTAGLLRPDTTWECLVDSVTYKVISVTPIRESGVDVVYYVQLRK